MPLEGRGAGKGQPRDGIRDPDVTDLLMTGMGDPVSVVAGMFALVSESALRMLLCTGGRMDVEAWEVPTTQLRRSSGPS